MTCKRGDVVLVRFPNSDLKTYKKRPALIVQSDEIDTGLEQKIIELITSNLSRSGPTRITIHKDQPEGQTMGLKTDSVIVADNLATILNREIDKVIGYCSTMHKVDYALKLILGLNKSRL